MEKIDKFEELIKIKKNIGKKQLMWLICKNGYLLSGLMMLKHYWTKNDLRGCLKIDFFWRGNEVIWVEYDTFLEGVIFLYNFLF